MKFGDDEKIKFNSIKSELKNRLTNGTLKGLMKHGPKVHTDYKALISNKYIEEIKLLDEKKGVIWVKNKSNKKHDDPDTSFFDKPIRRVICNGTRPMSIKNYLKDIWSTDKSSQGPGSAITTLLLVAQKKKDNKYKRRNIIFATSATNQKINGGQVHAEYITTRIVSDLTSEWMEMEKETLVMLKFYTLTSEVRNKKNSKQQVESSFPPCTSCKNSLAEIYKHLKSGNKELTQYGDARIIIT